MRKPNSQNNPGVHGHRSSPRRSHRLELQHQRQHQPMYWPVHRRADRKAERNSANVAPHLQPHSLCASWYFLSKTTISSARPPTECRERQSTPEIEVMPRCTSPDKLQEYRGLHVHITGRARNMFGNVFQGAVDGCDFSCAAASTLDVSTACMVSVLPLTKAPGEALSEAFAPTATVKLAVAIARQLPRRQSRKQQQ